MAARPRHHDVVLPAVIAVVGLVEIVAGHHRPEGPTALALLVLCAVLVPARSFPLAVPVLVGLGYAAAAALGADAAGPGTWVVVLGLACFDAGLYAPSRVTGLAAAAVTMAIAGTGLDLFTGFDSSVLFGVVIGGGAWALGAGLRDGLERSRLAGVWAERERATRLLAAERATTSVREHLATEIPDVLAHAVSAMVVQADVAADDVRRRPELAAAGFTQVAGAGRDALAQTGAVLYALRERRPGTQTPLPPPDEPQPSRPPVWRVQPSDVLLPSLAAVLLSVEAVFTGVHPLAATVTSGWLTALALIWRRRLPLAMPPAVVVGALVARAAGVPDDGPAAMLILYLLAFFVVGRYLPVRRWPVGAAVVLGSLVVLLAGTGSGPDSVLPVAGALLPWLAGLAVSGTLTRTRRLAAEAEQHQLAAHAEAERAAAAERARAARAVHDLLADALHVMVVQATLAAELAGREPATAGLAARRVRDAGHLALERLGALMKQLRSDGDTQPQPTLGDVPALAQRFREAGLGVDLVMDGVPGLPAALEVSAYHVVRESLTNTLKHAPGSEVQIRLTRAGSRVEVDVRNGPPASPATPVSSGYGLVGLRERVQAFGGHLVTAGTSDGGFHLSAIMPLPAPDHWGMP